MRITCLLRVALFAAVIGAGLVGPAAFAAELNQSSSKPEAGQSAVQDDKKASEDKDDKGKTEPKDKDDKNNPAGNEKKTESEAKDEKKNPPGKDDKKNKSDDVDKENISKAGNAGAIFIKAGPTTGPGNQPHVGCQFYVSGMNFSSTSGTLAFYAWKPTGSFQQVNPVTGPSTYTGSAPSKQAGGSNSDFLNGPYSLPTEGQTPQEKQGYHYKVEAIDANGKKVNSKVFWVDCQPTTGANTVTQPNTTTAATPTPTTPTPVPTLSPGTTPSGTPLTTGTPVTTPLATTTSGSSDATAGTPATVATAPVAVTLTMPITVSGPSGSIDLPAGTRITVPTGTTLTSLPGAPAPAPQFVEIESGTVLGTTAHGAVTSDEEAIGEVVLGEQVSILPTALPRTGGAPLGAAATLGVVAALAGFVLRRRSAA